MAPWDRLRSDRSGAHKEGKKRPVTPSRPRSRPESHPEEQPPPAEESPSAAAPNHEATAPVKTPAPRRNHRTRDSVVSLSAVPDPVSPSKNDAIPPRVPLLEISEAEPATVRPQRFSLLRFRHASDSQLSKTAQQHRSPSPPIPAAPPSIITTAPTSDNFELQAQKRRSTFSLARRSRAFAKRRSHAELQQEERDNQETPIPPMLQGKQSFEPERRSQTIQRHPEPPPYGDERNSMLALPVSRVSESSRSDASSSDHRMYAQTTTTHTVSTTTTFFRLPRRKKNKGPLFPLPAKTNSNMSSLTNTPRMSSARTSESPVRPSFTENEHSGQESPVRGAMRRNDSRTSGLSQSSLGRPVPLEQRGRSSTLSSLRKQVGDEETLPTPPLPISTRTSTSTTGRPSFGGLFAVTRGKADALGARGLRHSEPATPASFDSKQNSFNLPREPAVVIPERQEGDTPAKYLARLEEVVNKGALVAILSKSGDEFMKNVLRSYMRRFKFFEDPLDMAIRKMLMYIELPKETQHIDRTFQSFADRYHECNPGIFATADDAYFVAFSILMLHTDAFNRNNKHKMSKRDYLKNALSQGGVSTEVLECFYDNTCYTTFIHLEDDVHIGTERAPTPKQAKKSSFKPGTTPKRSQSGPVDPYTLILENRLDLLRPALDDVLVMEDSFTFLAPNTTLNLPELNKSFFKSGVIQILSTRSRPEAFANQATVLNPFEASVGVVDIKVTKVGIIWRKDPKKKKTRSPWQEWGVILTGSQLYFFRNTSWVKNLMHQYEYYYKHHAQGPVVFKPPLEHFKPDFLVSLDDTVALVDSRYKKHKNAFLLARQDNYSEVLLADTETEYRDWLAKINYAAAFRSAGVRMRGMLGLQESRRSEDSGEGPESASNDSESRSENRSRSSAHREELTEDQQIIIARRQIMGQKIQEFDARVRGMEKAIDSQMRNGRHLKILTPIQQKTREDLTLSAMHLAELLRSTHIAKWRTRCYRKMLALDLEDDLHHTKTGRSLDGDWKEATPQNSRDSEKGRLPFVRLGSKQGNSSSRSRSRPSTQPSGQKIFSMDEIFRTPSRLRAQNGKRAAWELPPINFERRKSTSQTRAPKDLEDQAVDDNEYESLASSSLLRENLRRTSSELGPRPEVLDKEEREILVQSGVDPERIAGSPEKDQERKKLEGDEAAKVGNLEDKDARSKARHSFQRKLQSGHTPAHQRSRKGKDSASTIVGSEETSSAAETERLTRAAGSFTLHGKKASVVTFGTEWQSISPEERLRLRKLEQESERSEARDSTDNEEELDFRSPMSVVPRIIGSPSFESAPSSLDHRGSVSDGELSPRGQATPRFPKKQSSDEQRDGMTKQDAVAVSDETMNGTTAAEEKNDDGKTPVAEISENAAMDSKEAKASNEAKATNKGP